MGKKSVEYHDTFEFRLFPEYTYTKSQQWRLRLFQGRIEHWRAAVNYADSFADGNRINLLYMLGYHPSMEAYMKKTKGNTVMLCAKIPQEFFEIYDTYWDLVKKYQSIGLADVNGHFLLAYYTEREKEEKYRGTGILSDDLYRRNDEEKRILEEYARIQKEIGVYFERYIIINKRGQGRTISYKSLDQLIRQYFPRGREQCGISENLYKFIIKKRSDALQAGLNLENVPKLLGLPDGTDCYTVCRRGIRRCQMYLNTAIRSNGVVDLVEVMEHMKAPPYGWDNEPHAAYCFGYAVSGYLDKTWIFDGIAFFPARDVIFTVLQNILFGHLGRRRSFMLVSEDGSCLSSRFAYMFGVETDRMSPKDGIDKRILELHLVGLSERKIAQKIGTMTNIAVHKRLDKMRTATLETIPFCDMARKCCQGIRSITRWPVAIVDERLRDTLCGVWDSTNLISTPVFGKERVREALSYFTPERCREIKRKFDQINSEVPAMIRRKYGANIDVDALQKMCTTTESGWLWDSETFWDCVERYLKNNGSG